MITTEVFEVRPLLLIPQSMTHYAIRRIFAGPLGSSRTVKGSPVVAVGVDRHAVGRDNISTWDLSPWSRIGVLAERRCGECKQFLQEFIPNSSVSTTLLCTGKHEVGRRVRQQIRWRASSNRRSGVCELVPLLAEVPRALSHWLCVCCPRWGDGE